MATANAQEKHDKKKSRHERLNAGPAAVEAKNLGSNAFDVTTRFLTPIFGGGVVTEDPTNSSFKPHDSVTPVRGGSVRGQLRFWWRATRGGNYTTIKDLYDAENELWGQASAPGLLHLVVTQQPTVSENLSSHLKMFEINQRGDGKFVLTNTNNDAENALKYIGFPLQPTNDRVKSGPAQSYYARRFDGEVKLRIQVSGGAKGTGRFDAAKAIEEARAAVWAWLLFGGLGGRTRRGFGSLALDSKLFPTILKDIENKSTLLKNSFIVQQKAPELVPSLHGAVYVPVAAQPKEKHEDVWLYLAGRLRELRQGPGIGRNNGQQKNRPGRSFWPEPDLLRQVTGHSDRLHSQPFVTAGGKIIEKVPRAHFGMPIIFHFQSKDDPKDTTLAPKGAERYGSPLIIKATGDQKTVAGAALVMGNRPDWNKYPITLGGKDRYNKVIFSPDLSKTEAESLRFNESNAQSPLRMFLDSI